VGNLRRGRTRHRRVAPIPDAEGQRRGVVVESSAGSRRVGRFRVMRYELRCWRDGAIPDADEAVASPQRLSNDREPAHGLLDLVPSVPMHVWGRDETGADDTWTSNSVISWLIIRSGLPTQGIGPPTGGS